MTEDDLPLSIVKGLRGVRDAFYLDRDIMLKVKREEMKVTATGNVPVINEGFNQALEHEKVICIVKDPRFRLPPSATVELRSSGGLLMGTEVFPETASQFTGLDNVIWLSDGFVVFTDKMPGPDEKQYFVMPPVAFPELNESNGCYDVISCSPAPTCDTMIREWHGLVDDGRLASILVAFNTTKS